MNLAMVVTQNMLNAHVQVYTTLKRMHPNSCIGIIHHYYPLKMYSWKRPWDKIGCAIGNNITNNATLNFFKNGTFSLYVPYKVAVKYVNPLAPQSLDFFGISYYSHGHLKNFKPTHTEPAELGTDKDTFVIHPEGLFHAVKLTAETLGNTMPIYIMENGIADAADTKRELFLQRYLYALGQASRLYNVKGYIYWSLMDNFEWNEGYRTCFGLYSVDWHTRTRAKRKSADYFAHIIRTYTVKYSS